MIVLLLSDWLIQNLPPFWFCCDAACFCFVSKTQLKLTHRWCCQFFKILYCALMHSVGENPKVWQHFLTWLIFYNTWHQRNVSIELHSKIRGKPSILQMRPGLKPMPYILASKWKNDLLTLEMFTLTPELDMPWLGKQFHHCYQPVDLHREKFTSGISRSLDLIRHPAGRGCRTSVRHASLCG